MWYFMCGAEMNIIKVGYNPEISHELKSFIKYTISPSMIDSDGDTGQYLLSFVLDQLKASSKCSEREYAYLKALDVEYIEI